jgi:hypothetical protein
VTDLKKIQQQRLKPKFNQDDRALDIKISSYMSELQSVQVKDKNSNRL